MRERFARYLPALCRLAAYLASLLVAAPFVYHLARGSDAYLGLLEDDYFYYAIIADNLVSNGRATYDGITLTNGFHPLWFGVIALLRAVCGGLGSTFYFALTLLFVLSMIATYELSRRFARQLGGSSRLSAGIAVVYSVSTGRLLTTGMECIVAVPLFLWLLVEVARPVPVTPRRAARLGLIASLAILGRLDIALAVALLLVGFAVLVRPPVPVLGRLFLAFGVGGILVPLYFALNLMFFGSPLPMSALAKRLYTEIGFNFTYARIAALGTVYGPTMAIVLPLGLLAMFLLVRREPSRRSAALFAGAIALTFAFVFLGVNALSGWTFFGWYAYPFAAATTAALVFIHHCWARLVPLRILRIAVSIVIVVGVPLVALRYYVDHGPRWSVGDNTLLAMSHDLAARVRQRDGLFAMGAIAGVATYVLDKPVLQLEGIVADRSMVEHVRREDPLPEVLRKYKADYLIVSLANVRVQARDGCYLVTQPHAEWAGDRTAKMRGEICAEPIEHFYTHRGSNPWSRFPSVQTLVWDLRSARWRDPRSAGDRLDN